MVTGYEATFYEDIHQMRVYLKAIALNLKDISETLAEQYTNQKVNKQ